MKAKIVALLSLVLSPQLAMAQQQVETAVSCYVDTAFNQPANQGGGGAGPWSRCDLPLTSTAQPGQQAMDAYFNASTFSNCAHYFPMPDGTLHRSPLAPLDPYNFAGCDWFPIGTLIHDNPHHLRSLRCLSGPTPMNTAHLAYSIDSSLCIVNTYPPQN